MGAGVPVALGATLADALPEDVVVAVSEGVAPELPVLDAVPDALGVPDGDAVPDGVPDGVLDALPVPDGYAGTLPVSDADGVPDGVSDAVGDSERVGLGELGGTARPDTTSESTRSVPPEPYAPAAPA